MNASARPGSLFTPQLPQNQREVDGKEQSCHPWESDSYYSIRIYSSMRRKSAFITSFYRRTLMGHYLGWTVFPVQS